MFSTVRMYHPSHRVLDQRATEKFFLDVFGRYSMSREALHMAGILKINPAHPDYPRDYCTFTPIADVFFDTIEPKKYVIEGAQRYADIEQPHLDGFGWAVNDIDALFSALSAEGIRCSNQINEIATGDKPPAASFSASPLFWTIPEDTGLRYEFYPAASIGTYDPRNIPGWSLPQVIPEDPLGIRRSSRHVILTADRQRALRLVVDILGGRVIHSAANEALEADSDFVLLGDDVFEYATPRSDQSAAGRDLASRHPHDSYHTIAWRVVDLDRVAAVLEANHVGITLRSEHTIITDPATSVGIPWWFTTGSIPNDPREFPGVTDVPAVSA